MKVKAQRLRNRSLAFCLLICLLPKLGLGLWTHEWLHHTIKYSSEFNSSSSHLNIQCSCLDDTLVPMDMVSSAIFNFKRLELCDLIEAKRIQIQSQYRILASLRGPPGK